MRTGGSVRGGENSDRMEQKQMLVQRCQLRSEHAVMQPGATAKKSSRRQTRKPWEELSHSILRERVLEEEKSAVGGDMQKPRRRRNSAERSCRKRGPRPRSGAGGWLTPPATCGRGCGSRRPVAPLTRWHEKPSWPLNWDTSNYEWCNKKEFL